MLYLSNTKYAEFVLNEYTNYGIYIAGEKFQTIKFADNQAIAIGSLNIFKKCVQIINNTGRI